MKKYIIGACTLLICVSLGLAIGSKISSENSEYKEVMAMMDSNASTQEKMIFLEGRVNKEMGSLNILVGYSDLCSSKYLNELDTLRLSMKTTIDAYELIKDDINSADNLVAKYTDYMSMYEEYDEMVNYIYDEEYEDALESLKKVNELREKEYFGIESDISKLGSN